MHDTVWAVVPLKSPDAAKSRLQAVLDAGARRHLVLAMARHVVRTLLHTPGIAGVAVATASEEVGALVAREGAMVLRQDGDAGTAQACRSAAASLCSITERLLMISGDIPLISPAAIRSIACSGAPAPTVVIVPDRHRTGTNALLCAPPAAVAPCFGMNSFARHQSAARAQGIEPCIVESELLALDIDEPDDLDELRRRLDADPALLPAEMREALLGRYLVTAQ